MDNREDVLSGAIRSLTELEEALRGRGDEGLAARLNGIIHELSRGLGKDTSPVVSPELMAWVTRSVDVEKCPRCALRSLHADPGQLRLGADGTTIEAMHWICASCGFEVWRPVARSATGSVG